VGAVVAAADDTQSEASAMMKATPRREHILTDRIRDIAERILAPGDESVDDTLRRMALVVPLRRYGTPQELASGGLVAARGKGD
jgi:hypothetical protein